MLLSVMKAEALKLRTTTSLWWTTTVALLIAVFAAYFLSADLSPEMLALFPVPGMLALAGIRSAAIYVLLLQAIMVVTTEFRYGVQRVNYLGAPKRSTLALAKWLVYGVFSAVYTLVLVFLCVGIARLASGGAPMFSLVDATVARALWTYPLAMFLLTGAGQAIGWLLRNTAAAITTILLWVLIIENVVEGLPTIGRTIAPWMPVRNLQAFMVGGDWSGNATSIPDNASGVYFLLWVLVLFVLGVWAAERRDA